MREPHRQNDDFHVNMTDDGHTTHLKLKQFSHDGESFGLWKEIFDKAPSLRKLPSIYMYLFVEMSNGSVWGGKAKLSLVCLRIHPLALMMQKKKKRPAVPEHESFDG